MKVVLSLSLLFAAAQGTQDSSYYPGFANPNTKDHMYYRDSVNVLQGIDAGEFDSLFIKYHGCVWSEYGSGQSNDANSGCGGDGSGQFWYLGRTQCFRANVAYSLYGVKNDQEYPSGNPCSSSGNYINSFFTTGGIESFGDNVGVPYANYGAATTCTATNTAAEEAEGGEGGRRTEGQAHGDQYYPDFTSTTLACSSSGAFIQATFQGAYCDGNHFLSNDGEVANLNTDLDDLGCYQIYSFDNNDNAALSLLSSSSACSHNEYPNTCPDPHGTKRKRDQKLIQYAKSRTRTVPLIMPILSTILIVLSAGLHVMANGIRDAAKRRELEAKTGESVAPTIAEKFSNRMTRVGTDISQRTRSYTEKIAKYAEEEDGATTAEGYTAPTDEAQTQSASAAVVSTDKTAPETETKYKRPRLARVSKFVRGRFGRKSQK